MNFVLTPFHGNPRKRSLHCSLAVSQDQYRLSYHLQTESHSIVIPDLSTTPKSVQGLYEHTCFETFLAGSGDRYLEYNFSPSGDWCLFCFDSYRKNASSPLLNPQAPTTAFRNSANSLELEAKISIREAETFLGEKPKWIGISAVIELRDGSKEYWALSHPDNKPDFHARLNFLPLP